MNFLFSLEFQFKSDVIVIRNQNYKDRYTLDRDRCDWIYIVFALEIPWLPSLLTEQISIVEYAYFMY